MPSLPKSYLSREKLDTSGGPTLLNAPRLRAPSGGIQLSAAAINPNAGMLRPRALAAPQETAPQYKNIVGPAVQNAGTSLAKAGMIYGARKSELRAQEANLEYMNSARDMTLGYEDQSGKFIPGYFSTKGQAASEGYGNYEAALNSLRAEIFEGLEKDAGSRFMAKSTGMHTSHLNNGAAHAAAGTRTWESQQLGERNQQFLVQMNDNSNNPQQMKALMEDYVTGLVKNGDVTPDKAASYTQGLYSSLGSFLSSQPVGASARLGSFMTEFGDYFTIDTQTKMNTLLASSVRREMTYKQQQMYDQEKSRTKREKAYNNNLWGRVMGGENVDWAEELTITRSGGGGSWGSFNAARSAYFQGESRPPISPTIEREMRSDLLAGVKDQEDIDVLEVNNTSKRRLNVYMESISGDRRGTQTKLMLPRLESIVSGSMPKGADRDVSILNVQNAFLGKVQGGMDADVAFSEVTRPYVNAGSDIAQFTLVTYGSKSTRPHNMEQARLMFKDIEAELQQGIITADEAEKAASQLRVFTSYFQSLEMK